MEKYKNNKKWWKTSGFPVIIYGVFTIVFSIILGLIVGDTMTVRILFFFSIFMILMGWFFNMMTEMVE